MNDDNNNASCAPPRMWRKRARPGYKPDAHAERSSTKTCWSTRFVATLWVLPREEAPRRWLTRKLVDDIGSWEEREEQQGKEGKRAEALPLKKAHGEEFAHQQ